MNTYNGIPISEHRLLMHTIVFTVLLIVLLIVVAFWVYTVLTTRSKKEKQHIKKLKEKAKTNEFAKKQLEKIKRKQKRKENKQKTVYDILVFSISLCLTAAILWWCVIPGWTDYLAKDYVVYTGEVEVFVQTRHSWIELEDGTTVWGVGGLEDDDHSATIVYSRRTKRLLGGYSR